jgi:hypothetical protein
MKCFLQSIVASALTPVLSCSLDLDTILETGRATIAAETGEAPSPQGLSGAGGDESTPDTGDALDEVDMSARAFGGAARGEEVDPDMESGSVDAAMPNVLDESELMDEEVARAVQEGVPAEPGEDEVEGLGTLAMSPFVMLRMAFRFYQQILSQDGADPHDYYTAMVGPQIVSFIIICFGWSAFVDFGQPPTSTADLLEQNQVRERERERERER